jgi:DNA-binding transcriptional MocR family regulator
MHIMPGNAGLHLCARILDPRWKHLHRRNARSGICRAPSRLSAYSIGRHANGMPGLCIGYGSAEVDQIAQAVRALAAALRLS